jgi:trigger factor
METMAIEEKNPSESGPPEGAPAEADATAPEEAGKKDEIPMKVTVEEAGTCRKKVRVEIEAARVGEDIRKGIEEIRTTVPMPGFRKGRVPKVLLSKKFGKRVLEDVRANLIAQAIDQEKIKPFTMPELAESEIGKIEIAEGKPLAFDFVVDVRPEVKPEGYAEMEVERPRIEVSKEEVDREVERLRLRRGRVVPVEGGQVQVRDSVVVNREYFLGEEKVHAVENVAVLVPEDGSRLLERSPWLKEFLGKKQGETVETPVTFPNDFPVEAVRGKEGRQRFSLLDIKRLEMPALDAAFLEEFGVGSEEDLRSRLDKDLRAAKEALADRIVEDALVDRLIEKTPMDLPEAVVAKQVEEALGKMETRLKEAKVPEADLEARLKPLREERRKAVEKELRAYFLMLEIAKKEKIFATEEEVDGRINGMAMSRGKWPSQMREELEEKDLLDQVREQVREDKVKTFLREKAKIKEGKLLEDLIREREGEHEGHDHAAGHDDLEDHEGHDHG